MTRARKPRASQTLYGANNRIVVLSNQIDQLKERVEGWERKFDDSVNMRADDYTHHERMMNGMRKDLAGTERARNDLQVKCNEQEDVIKELRDRIDVLDRACDEKEQSLNTWRDQFELSQKHYAMLESGIVALVKRIS